VSAFCLQAQVNNTICIIRENIKKVLEREESLDLLQDKTNNLAVLLVSQVCAHNARGW
jgi:hypothetical protein